MSNRRRQLHLWISILIMGFIFFQSALPAELSSRESGVIVTFLAGIFRADPERLTFAVRKLAHFTEYLLLGLSLLYTVRDIALQRKLLYTVRDAAPQRGDMNHATPYQKSLLNYAAAAWCIGTIYAVTDEIHQYFVPGRSCELRDMLIDSCGVAVGVICGRLLMRHREKRKRG